MKLKIPALFIVLIFSLEIVSAVEIYGTGTYGGGIYGKSECGNAICESDESCSSCSTDCGSCPSGGGGGGGGGGGYFAPFNISKNETYVTKPQDIILSCSEWGECSKNGLQTRNCIIQRVSGVREKFNETVFCKYVGPQPVSEAEKKAEFPSSITGAAVITFNLLGKWSCFYTIILLLIIILILIFLLIRKKKKSVIQVNYIKGSGVIAKTGIVKEPGYLYFIDQNGDIARVRMARRGKKTSKKHELILKVGVKRRKGYLYYIDKNCNICQAKMKWLKDKENKQKKAQNMTGFFSFITGAAVTAFNLLEKWCSYIIILLIIIILILIFLLIRKNNRKN